MQLPIINNSPYELPQYKTSGSSGMDLRANIRNTIILHPGETILIPTGICIALPEGYEAQIRPRSGLSLKGIVAELGTIDSDYRGDIGIILNNRSHESFCIEPGDRLAQMVIVKVEHVNLMPTASLPDTDRSTRGFGHTGI